MVPQIGEFDVDPESIPEQPKIPENTDVTLEVAHAERVEVNNEKGRSVRAKIRVSAPDYPGASNAFATLWVTEKYRGDPHRSYAQFLIKTKLPFTTQIEQDLKGFRFVGQVRPNAKNPDYLDLSKVIGPVA